MSSLAKARIWAVGAREYSLTRVELATGGEDFVGIVRSAWFHAADPADRSESPEAAGRIWGGGIAGLDSLWVVGSAPEATPQAGSTTPVVPGQQTLESMTSGHGTIIELIDGDGRVQVSTRFSSRRIMPLSGSLVYEAQYGADDLISLQIHTLTVGRQQ